MSEQKPTSPLRKAAIALVIVFGAFVGLGLIGTMLQPDATTNGASQFADEAEEGLKKIEEAQRRADEYDSAPKTP